MSKPDSGELKRHSLRTTPVRLDVLEYFRSAGKALSHADLEQHFTKDYDRVTIYRTLNTFLESGLLHKIPDDSGSAKYALCHEACDTHQHADDHVHFKCHVCGSIECLHSSHIPGVSVPEGYTVRSANLLLEGTCSQCSQ
jgi:Fur family transcriptional regulator, ferric uptake regulator